MSAKDFAAGRLLLNTAVWETSILELESFGFTVPAYVKRMVKDGQLNLFDSELFRNNHRDWKFNKKRYSDEASLRKSIWKNYSGCVAYKAQFLKRLKLLVGWSVIAPVLEEDFKNGTPDGYMINPVNFIERGLDNYTNILVFDFFHLLSLIADKFKDFYFTNV